MPSSPPIQIQLGIFGEFTEIAGMHVVAAHMRTRTDGTEVFVSEHLRWDRGRQMPRPTAPRRSAAPPVDHPSLFDPVPEPRPGPEMEEMELFPGAYQLPLWPATRSSS